jgi:hydroxyacylglutathione hydrolase
MFEGLARLAALPPETWIFCAHEYTEDNLRFAVTLEPDNAALAERVAEGGARRARGEATVPGRLATELATNPFLRATSEELVANLRREFPQLALDTPVDAFAATRKLKDSKRYRRFPSA